MFSILSGFAIVKGGTRHVYRTWLHHSHTDRLQSAFVLAPSEELPGGYCPAAAEAAAVNEKLHARNSKKTAPASSEAARSS